MRLLAPLLCLAAASVALAVEPIPYVVPARMPNVAETLSPSRIDLGGWLGARVSANEENRLLRVDLNPLLAGFRRKPGSHPWIGEHIGKWLHAATLAWAHSQDPAFKAKLDRAVADLIACQEPDGYLGTYVPEQRFALHKGADWDVWSHKYNLIGLLTYHQYTADAPALSACRRMADLLIATFPARRSILAAVTHGVMASTIVLEPIVLLYRATGDDRYLAFAKYIVGSWDEPKGPKILATLAAGKGVDETGNAKAYEMLSNLVGLCELARVTGERAYLAPVIHAWEDVVANRLYLTGSASAAEHFRKAHDLPNRVEAHIGETCVTTTWIQLNLQLLQITGDNRYAEELQKAIYNHLAAAQLPRGDDWCYYTALEGRKQYDAGITCCHSSGPRGMALAVQTTYLKTRLGDTDAVRVDTFETSRVTLDLGGRRVLLDQVSDFPRDGRTTLTIRAERQAKFALLVRKPAWASRLTASVRGSSAAIQVRADGSLTLSSNEWCPETSIEVHFDLGSRTIDGGLANPGRSALAWGPFVLAYDEVRNPDGPAARVAGLAPEMRLARIAGPDLAFRGEVVGREGAPRPGVFVPFADAGSTGGLYRLWLRSTGTPPPANVSLLADGEESRSRNGNISGSILDGEPSTFVVTFDGKKPAEDWFAVTLNRPATIARVVYHHGSIFHDGGWFVADRTKPRIEIQADPGGPWSPVGELTDYPPATFEHAPDLQPGRGFELRLKEPMKVCGVRVVGIPAGGDGPRQAFSSCGELEAFAE